MQTSTRSFQVANADAVTWLRDLPDGSVDLVVTDPPYESLEKHRSVGTTTRLTHSKASSNDWFTTEEDPTVVREKRGARGRTRGSSGGGSAHDLRGAGARRRAPATKTAVQGRTGAARLDAPAPSDHGPARSLPFCGARWNAMATRRRLEAGHGDGRSQRERVLP
jgi:hypothetical protein